MASVVALILWLFASQVVASPYDPFEVNWNLNTNQDATHPLDYSGQWEGHNYTASPDNWRFPFYTLFLDRFVNGDPENDNINGTLFEHDPLSTLFRHGGDVAGLVDSLDYLQGMGIKGIYIAGTVLLSFPWAYDQYSPYDTTILDHHSATLVEWQAAIDEIHRRGMYLVLDTTGSTMSDLLAFEGYLNVSAPFVPKEHKVRYKTERRYRDFNFGNTYNETCEYPRFWNDSGHRVLRGSSANFDMLGPGCYDSDFDQYGDTEAFGVFPDWQRQLSKFASVQDRLREWVPSVRLRIEHFACLIIGQLDIDGFRYDKATQMTPDPIAEMAKAMRSCARNYGKENFLVAGEIAGGNNFGSIYIGRGREPEMATDNITEAILTTNADNERFIRNETLNGFDNVAFHYSIYRTLLRFLGVDGIVSAGYDVPPDLVDTWNVMLTTNDMLNANTGKFDPRHMWGASNQDVFRWPTMVGGIDRQLLALFVTTLHMPGIPLLLWGEEQAFYIMDNTAANYVFGRQSMSSSPAWQMHGCYKLGSTQYINWPLDKGLYGCQDETATYDHRDPSHPVRNIIKSMYALRDSVPVLRDGFNLQSLSKQTHQVQLPYSGGTPTEYGMWSVVRNKIDAIDELQSGNQSVWFVYQNNASAVDYTFDCTQNETALLAPFAQGTQVRNLLAPYDEVTLENGPGKKLFIDKSQEVNGCLGKMSFGPYGFKAYVPASAWAPPPPMLTHFVPGHDARLNSSSRVAIELHFSTEMDCDSVTAGISLKSTTADGTVPTIDKATVKCAKMEPSDVTPYNAFVPSTWGWSADLDGVSDGIHRLTVQNETTIDGVASTSVDHLLFRIGSQNNPMVFTNAANYTRGAYTKASGELVFTPNAAGADKWRYSTNWGSSWTNWTAYDGKPTTITELPWSGTKLQRWSGHHITTQYWSGLVGSSSHLQHADADWPDNKPARWFPHLFAQGLYNSFGYDAGLPNYAHQDDTGLSKFHFSSEWPATIQFNVWGMNPDGKPDKTYVFGDVNADNVLDRMVPQSLAAPVVNITDHPPAPHLAYEIQIDQGSQRYTLVPVGTRSVQVMLFALLWVLPVISASLAIWAYMGFFYKIKFNATGISKKGMGGIFGNFRKRQAGFEKIDEHDKRSGSHSEHFPLAVMKNRSVSDTTSMAPTLAAADKSKRRTVLIATIEYDIEDWNIKVKIGGLGVMAQLMGKALGEQDLIWVVPCVGGIEFPIDQVAEPMTVTILENEYEVQVQYHKLRNITYVLLDAPVFRQQTKAEPYPPRMDDLDSAIYYSAWNACIAEACRRFPVDIYHINDYHGAAAPLYLLPRTIPCCLSLHNAEFQGLWPMRGKKEQEEVCKAFNLSREVVQEYVQFGEVFNLLHAGASYLRVHQKGFGAVGVSNKYGPRSWARYPIFWQLKSIGKLPNPDPSDVEPYNKEQEMKQLANIKIDPAYEAARGDLRKQAQEWAGLKVDPNAELFVFVGRWSVQKGIDLIADVFPAVLDKHANVQLICVGPVIDLHGKFAALKLEQIMKKYPGRVYSKPEFTALPPFIFSGAEFALIPSRDEPFGLVAVEFGRKGALGVGARVGGLGQMPGWWFTVESDTSKHMMHQFKAAIEDALSSPHEVRADMRARSAKQRFPVAQWVEDLEALQSASIRIHEKEKSNLRKRSGAQLEILVPPSRNFSQERLSMYEEEEQERDAMMEEQPAAAKSGGGLNRSLSLGVRAGPGHRPSRLRMLVPTDEADADEDETMEVPISHEEAEAAQQHLITGRLREINDLDTVVPRAIARLNEQRERSSLIGTPRIAVQDPTPIDPRPMNFSRGGSSGMRSPSPGSGSASPSPSQSLFPLSAAKASRSSLLSLDGVMGGRHDYNLQKIELNFTDKTGEYYNKFQAMLEKDLNAKTSESSLAIEDFLKDSEKEWSARYRAAKLGRSPLASRAASPAHSRRNSSESSRRPSMVHTPSFPDDVTTAYAPSNMDEFLMQDDYVRPSILKRWLRTRVFDWPIYSIFLAIGQIMAANSYQVVLITGGNTGNETLKIYVISTIYLIGSLVWWLMYRRLKPRFVLSVPFACYGITFTIIGLAPFIPYGAGRDWARNVATGFYALASASGSLYFALNFGDEGGSPIKAWIYRACLIQGIQQIYIVALFYWGRTISEASAAGIDVQDAIANKTIMAAVSLPIAAVLFFIGLLLFTSLPPYYRQTPGKIPDFYRSLVRRKLIMWFLVSVILQNYFLSATYGRSWAYLWSSTYAPKWAIALLVLVFFIGVWTVILLICAQLSKQHSWFLPMFAFGLLAPRWAQMWWGTSSYGLWLPWMPGGPVAGALAGRSLWLWLGVLDSIQGVGIGMALLQTLTRIHVAVVLTAAQVLGAAITILAKGTSPDRNGPGSVFPDLSAGVVAGLTQPWFWIALACQLVIPVGYFFFFRKEQLSKP